MAHLRDTQFECNASIGERSTTFPSLLTLGHSELSWIVRGGDKTTARVPYSCIYGYEAPSANALDQDQALEDLIRRSVEDRQIVIHFLEFVTPDLASAPRLATAHLLFEERQEAALFMERAWELGVFPKPRKLLVLVNPKGGVGRAKTISDTIVKPMLKHSGLTVKEQYTEYGRHAVDIAHKVNLQDMDTLIVVSGDGVLHEVFNGLLSRPDWDQARRLPVGIVPAGSGNAIAKSLGTTNQYVATLAAIRGETAKMDIFSMSQLDRPRIFSMLMFSWGMTADADIESDKYRWLGPLRFEIAGFVRMIRLRRYPGKVYTLPPRSEGTSIMSMTPPTSPDQNGPPIHHGALLRNVQEEPPKPWKLLPDMPFYSFLLLLNHPSLNEDVLFSKSIKFNDGIMRLWYSCETRFWKILLPFVRDQSNGKLVERGLMKDLKCGGVLIVPGVEGKPEDESTHEIVDPAVRSAEAKKQDIYTKPGIFDVDGEVMPTTRTLIEILPSFVDIIVPEWFNQDQDQDEASLKARAKGDLILDVARTRQKVVSQIRESALILAAMAVTVTSYALFFSEGFQVWSGLSRYAPIPPVGSP